MTAPPCASSTARASGQLLRSDADRRGREPRRPRCGARQNGGKTVGRLLVGVLAPGNGSNLQAIIDSSLTGRIDVEVAVVVSDVADAHALERARSAGIPAVHVPPGSFRTKLTPEVEQRYVDILEEHGVQVVVLAGFMRILHDDFLKRYSGRVVNVHPALLPSFPGLHAQKQALDYGVKWTGATVHFVDAGVDTGPIILQAVVPVMDGDSEETLSA
ncbi:MAG: phosphoribosylglycinamide formyltransferase, partial [Candidatus Eisenbacteria sp.]|nr:phosphoribosylglycinamide formyltransferase [Candidatus Eisenbacteria bacterium]